MFWPVRLMALIRSRTAGDRGATATEYAILMAFIAVVIVLGITVFGGDLNGGFTSFAQQLGVLFGQ